MTKNPEQPLLRATELSLAFREQQVISKLNFTLMRGTMTSLLGANGVGKTTLVRMLIGQLKPTGGKITYFNQGKVDKIGYVPQFRNIDAEYPLSIESFVGLNLLNHRFFWKTPSEKAQLQQALAQTGLTDLAKRTLGSASGGEKQKAYLAQALIESPEFLILDESTASLDVKTKVELMDLVAQLNQQANLTVLFVTHDIDLARNYTQQFLLLKRHQASELQPITALPKNLDLS